MKQRNSTPPGNGPVIVILSYNRVKLLRRCVESIFRHTGGAYTLCVVDQASTDGTRRFLTNLGDRVEVLSPGKNLGFVEGNNLAMEHYAGRDIVLLNNDTEVTAGWLDALIDRASSDEKIGVVTGKLVYPDGRLQAAGCEIFSDASGREIGKWDDPQRHIYTVAADVDYGSGACLYLKRTLLDTAGFFDTRFAPAYWEDTDLCFSARKHGFRVVYEPSAVVIHHEGGSYGKNAAAKSKSARLQAAHKPKFVEKWKDELVRHRSNVFEIPPDRKKEKVLVILPFLPLFDRAAGEMRWFHTLRILAEKYQVVFLARNGRDGIRYINPLEEMGITVFHTDQDRLRMLGCEMRGPLWIDFPTLLRSNDFRAVIVGFWHMAAQYYADIRRWAPQAKLIIDSFDVSFLREQRRAELSGEDSKLWKAQELKRVELLWYRKADMVLTVTERDRDVLLGEDPALRVGISTDIHPLPPFEWKEDARDLVYIGNFQHNPNEDAVVYFTREILPLVHEELPDVKFRIVGNGPTAAVRALAGKKVEVTGYVPDIVPYLRESRVCVVPLRYGAGLKGKVGQAMAAGAPQVSTSIGVEGMGLVHGHDVLIADTPGRFAREVIRLYRDDNLRKQIALNARERVARQYSVEEAKRYWEEVFEFIQGPRKTSRSEGDRPTTCRETLYTRPAPVPAIVPKVSIVIPVYNNLALTANCRESIRKYTKMPHEIVIVDNGSEEPVAFDAEQNHIRVIRNETNLGFAAAVNQGIRSTYGEYVVILNNDTIVTPGWLERLIAHLEDDPKIGVIAPMTNYANNEQRITVDYSDEATLVRFSRKLARENRKKRRDVRKVVGMCMAIRRRVIEEVGLFDTRFGIGNFEDDDYCIRVRMAGYSLACALDTFIHHEGGKTFAAMNVDYERLLRVNSELFLAKWGSVAGRRRDEDAPRVADDSVTGNRAGAEPPVLTVILFQDGEDLRIDDVAAGLGQLPAGSDVRFVCTDPARAGLFRDSDVGIVPCDPGRFYAVLDGEIRAARSPFVLVLSGACKGGGAWFDEIADVAIERERFGLIAPLSNAGPQGQRKKTEYGNDGARFESFAERLLEKNHGVWKQSREIGGWCVFIRKEAYVDAGGLPTEFTSAAAWSDLAARMLDLRWTTGCALGSFVHYDGPAASPGRIDEGEQRAVTHLIDAERFFARGDFASARSSVEEALSRKSDYVRALYYRAMFRSSSGRLDDAKRDLLALRRVNPRFAKAANDLGCIAFEEGRDTEAEKYFLEARALAPRDAEILKNLGDFYFASHDPVKGMKLYSERIALDPGDPEAYLELGGWFERLGEVEGAADWYRQVIRVAPETVAGQDARVRLTALEGKDGTKAEEETPSAAL